MGNDDTKLYAFDPGGGVKWTSPIGGHLTTAPNIAADGTILVGGGSGNPNVFALDRNGGQRWKFTTGGDIWSSPTIGPDGTIYFGSEDSHLYALRPDGTMKWSYPASEGLQTAIVGTNGVVYFNGKPSLCAVDANGQLQWVTATDGDSTIPALGADGTLYAGTAAGSFYAFDEKGQVKWKLMLTPFDTWSQPVVGADGIIYAGAMDGSFYALEAFGAVKWKLMTGGAIHGAPAIGADGTVYFGSDDGKLYAVGP
jgi:outer membrane protein assembly factor BamB